MPNQKICEANKALGLEIREFMTHVPDVKEESITDYLVWKWKLLDARFSYLNIKTFTRQEEHSTTGADFELELWLLGEKTAVPLLFQAKKFTKPYDAYMSKLNYPGGTQAQLKKLLAYSTAKKLLPFYMIYTSGGGSAKTMCGGPGSVTGAYMIDAETIREFADGKHGKQVSLGNLLGKSNPFHCLFCCPLGAAGEYFKRYFQQAPDSVRTSVDDLPAYVQALREDNSVVSREKYADNLPNVRAIGVYDIRDLEDRDTVR